MSNQDGSQEDSGKSTGGISSPLERLQLENSALRLKLESLDRLVAEVTPELDGLSLEARIKRLKVKSLELSKDKLRLGVLVRHIRKLLISSVNTEENKTNLDQAKKLLDQELYKK
jgi:hypothetical protein